MTDHLEAGREAFRRGDLDEARRLLAPLVEDDATGPASIVLARVELEADFPEPALAMLDAFLDGGRKHGGATLLRARARLATGDLAGARADAAAAAGLMPEPAGAERVLARIAVAEQAARERVLLDRAKELSSILDHGCPAARHVGPTHDLVEAARELAALALGGDWAKDAVQARAAYFRHAADVEAALANYDAHLIEVAVRLGYVTWPRRIQEHIRGRSVLDVGSGFGGFGMGYLIAGATSYVGVDPRLDPDSSLSQDKHDRAWVDVGITPREINATFPAIRLFHGTAEELDLDDRFGAIVLHNVTEHLTQLDEVFRGLRERCEPDSLLVFHHHNFFCWNGHHNAPRVLEELDPSDPDQRVLYDWGHVGLPPDHDFTFVLNRVRLDELRVVVERYFEIDVWEEKPSSPQTLARLTPEVVARVRESVPDMTERELATHVVLCVAIPLADVARSAEQ